MFILNEWSHFTEEQHTWMNMTKSDSQVSGPALAQAHMALGQCMGDYFRTHLPFPPEETTVIALLRGGIFFAQGIYFSGHYKFQLYDPKSGHPPTRMTPYTIVVDSVVNSGKTVLPFLETPNTVVACCVASTQAVDMVGEQLYTVRVSPRSYVGSAVSSLQGEKGPDTTLRLFHWL